MKIIVTALCLLMIASFIGVQQVSAANIIDESCNNIATGPKPTACSANPGKNGSGFLGQDSAIGGVIRLLGIAAGVIGVIMLIIGGLKFVTSSGDSSNVASARNTILYAIVGLVIAMSAQLIIIFVLDKL